MNYRERDNVYEYKYRPCIYYKCIYICIYVHAQEGTDGSCVPGWGAGRPSQQSLEVESPSVRDIEGLGLAAASWGGIEDIHTLAAGAHHISHKAGAVTADIL